MRKCAHNPARYVSHNPRTSRDIPIIRNDVDNFITGLRVGALIKSYQIYRKSAAEHARTSHIISVVMYKNTKEEGSAAKQRACIGCE